jgi:phosphate transport system permease protein
MVFLSLLFISIFGNGYSAFQQTFMKLDVHFDPEVLDEQSLATADYQGLVKKSLRNMFPGVEGRRDKRMLYSIVSSGASFQLRDMVLTQPDIIGQTLSVWVPADDDVDMLVKGHFDRDAAEGERRLKDKQLTWIDQLMTNGKIEKRFNTIFFTAGDSREPELAGILGAASGSFFTLVITLLLSFPIGVAAAVYLEEFAPKNRWTDLIEVNINNLAAVPSIVFGLLGLAVFLNFFGLPRSAPVVGGLVLTLMTLPVIIIASRSALTAVPPSIREAALGVGASKMQMVAHHVLPLAMPGMLTGTIIGMARALGETAPLLMIGMVAFIVDIPAGFTDPSTALPVQIYLWADSPERAFVERTSAAIIILLGFLITMNAAAVILRKRYERRW